MSGLTASGTFKCPACGKWVKEGAHRCPKFVPESRAKRMARLEDRLAESELSTLRSRLQAVEAEVERARGLWLLIAQSLR
jgi:hypothetical protein